ncbi:putative secreted protein [Propionispora sp. 2/2-37]|uniref:glycosyl hydrolase 53 family protein n=1 Tax=Propionispora sp. 2/2-37 TaxID=1677858 RepID=UPI0006BB7480|nr:glycosyl hydrolase 53 family protein [Propionispora sp. 2/2-37]CUH94991.1 putative secreted protein [Propionispora sp. 2/2-37]
MKRKILPSLVLAALVFGYTMLCTLNAAAESIQVNPIVGISPDFIKGADISMLKQLEMTGSKFYDDNGVARDCMEILKEHGINWVRLRIWNNPEVNGLEVGGGNTDEAKALEMAARAKKLGMKVLIDFHYSDWWADPGKQNKPAAWANHSGKQLEKDVYEFTKKVMQDFKARGIMPEMVQIGNELNNGMLWPEGQLTGSNAGGYKVFAGLVKAGLRAVRDVDSEHYTKLMIHLANGGDNGLYRSFFDEMTKNQKVNDFDIIGLSYYPVWHGTLEQLQNNMNDISARYNKDVIVVETAYGFTLDNADTQKNAFGAPEEKLSGYKASVQGQATCIRNVMEAVVKVPGKKGLGIFYWEPDWIPNPQAPWKTGEGNEWENQAMFDFDGKVLESMDVFNRAADPNGRYVEAVMEEAYPVEVKASVNQSLDMPKVVSVRYSDDSVKAVPVSWNNPGTVYDKVGHYTLYGTVARTPLTATARITVDNKVNLVRNSGFEINNFDNWAIEGDTGAVNISSSSGDVRDKYALHYWADKTFKFTVKQTITGLKKGKYTLSGWTQGGGGEKSMQLFAADYGGEKLTAEIKNDGWNKWHQWTIKGIPVTSGKITIGMYNEANAGNWGSLDDVTLYIQENAIE